MTSHDEQSKYIEAAELIHSEEFDLACLAIASLGMSSLNFAYFFKPPILSLDDGWFGEFDIPENREARIYALLLMGEITKDMEG